MTKEKTKDKIAKPVYFNTTNDKEKEIIEWIDSKFSSFGGLVKDLLYQQMIREKNGIQSVIFNEDLGIKDDDINNQETSVDESEVKDVEC